MLSAGFPPRSERRSGSTMSRDHRSSPTFLPIDIFDSNGPLTLETFPFHSEPSDQSVDSGSAIFNACTRGRGDWQGGERRQVVGLSRVYGLGCWGNGRAACCPHATDWRKAEATVRKNRRDHSGASIEKQACRGQAAGGEAVQRRLRRPVHRRRSRSDHCGAARLR